MQRRDKNAIWAFDRAHAPIADSNPKVSVMAVLFDDVKSILDELVNEWSAQNGREAQLSIHGPDFKWGTKEELVSAMAFHFRLIDPEVIGSLNAHTCTLVRALSSGVDGFPRMPVGGPYASEKQIARIVEWIRNGCPTVMDRDLLFKDLHEMNSGSLMDRYRRAVGIQRGGPIPDGVGINDMIDAILDAEFPQGG